MEPGFIPFNTENRPCGFLLIFVRNGAPTEDIAEAFVFQLPQFLSILIRQILFRWLPSAGSTAIPLRLFFWFVWLIGDAIVIQGDMSASDFFSFGFRHRSVTVESFIPFTDIPTIPKRIPVAWLQNGFRSTQGTLPACSKTSYGLMTTPFTHPTISPV